MAQTAIEYGHRLAALFVSALVVGVADDEHSESIAFLPQQIGDAGE